MRIGCNFGVFICTSTACRSIELNFERMSLDLMNACTTKFLLKKSAFCLSQVPANDLNYLICEQNAVTVIIGVNFGRARSRAWFRC